MLPSRRVRTDSSQQSEFHSPRCYQGIDPVRVCPEIETLAGTIDVAAAELEQSLTTLLSHLVRRVKKHLGQRNVAVDIVEGSAVEFGDSVETLFHVHDFGSLGKVRIAENDAIVDGTHGWMHSHSHGHAVLAVGVGWRDLVVVERWTEHKHHSEVYAQLERAEANARLAKVVVMSP